MELNARKHRKLQTKAGPLVMLCLPVLRARPAHAVGQRCRIKGRPGCRRAWSVKASRLVSRTNPCLLPWSADRYKHRPTLSLARVAAHDALHYDQGSTCEHGTGGTLPAHQMRPARPYLCDCEQVETSKRRRARVSFALEVRRHEPMFFFKNRAKSWGVEL